MSQFRASLILDGDERRMIAALQRGEAGMDAFGRTVARQSAQTKSAAASAEVFAQALEGEKRAFDQLRQSIDPVYRASRQYEAIVNETQRAVTVGTATQAEANRMLALAEAQYLATGRSAAVMGSQTGAARHNVANLFANMNDVAVMAVSGQNPIMLMMQQGTQFNQVLATMGSRAEVFQTLRAAALSMISPMSLMTLGIIGGTAALVQWGISAVTAEEKTDKFAETIKSLSDEAEDARTKVRLFLTGADSAEELTVLTKIAEIDARIAEIRSDDRARNVGRHVEQLEAERASLAALLSERDREIAQAERIERIQSQANRAGAEYVARIEARKEETAAAEELLVSLQNQASVQALITQFGADSAAVASLRVQQEREAFVELTNSRDISDGLKSELIAAWDAANGLAGTDMASTLSSAASQAERIAAALGIAVSSAIALANSTPEMQDEDAVMSQNVLPTARDRAGHRNAVTNFGRLIKPKKKGGGGGASEIKERAREHERAVKDIERFMTRLAPSYAKDTEALLKWRTDSLAALDPTKEGYKQFAEDVETVFGLRLAEAYREDLERREDWAAGVERAFLSINDDMLAWADVGQNLAERWSSGLEDAFVSLNRTGKVEIGDLVDFTLEQFARLAYQQSIQPAVNNIFGGLSDIFKNLFGGGSPLTQSHAGSTIGAGGVRRSYGPNAPMRKDERLAVLTAGQRVFTPEQISNGATVVDALAAAAAQPAQGGVTAVTFAPEIRIINASGQSVNAQINDRGEQGGRRRFDVVLSEQVGHSLNAPGGGASKSLKKRFGLSPRGALR